MSSGSVDSSLYPEDRSNDVSGSKHSGGDDSSYSPSSFSSQGDGNYAPGMNLDDAWKNTKTPQGWSPPNKSRVKGRGRKHHRLREPRSLRHESETTGKGRQHRHREVRPSMAPSENVAAMSAASRTVCSGDRHEDYSSSSSGEDDDSDNSGSNHKTDAEFQGQVNSLRVHTGLGERGASNLLVICDAKSLEADTAVEAIPYFDTLMCQVQSLFPSLTRESRIILLERSRFDIRKAMRMIDGMIKEIQQRLVGDIDRGHGDIIASLGEHGLDIDRVINDLEEKMVAHMHFSVSIQGEGFANHSLDQIREMLERNNWSFTDTFNAIIYPQETDDHQRQQRQEQAQQGQQQQQAQPQQLERPRRRREPRQGESRRSGGTRTRHETAGPKTNGEVTQDICGICGEVLTGIGLMKDHRICKGQCQDKSDDKKLCGKCRTKILRKKDNAECPWCKGPAFGR